MGKAAFGKASQKRYASFYLSMGSYRAMATPIMLLCVVWNTFWKSDGLTSHDVLEDITRAASCYKSCILLQRFTQMTRVYSDDKSFLRGQEFAQMTRAYSDGKGLL